MPSDRRLGYAGHGSLHDMTLVQYFVDFLRPYAKDPEFTSCVMKALKELGHDVNVESVHQEPIKSCRIDDPTLPKDMWGYCDE